MSSLAPPPVPPDAVEDITPVTKDAIDKIKETLVETRPLKKHRVLSCAEEGSGSTLLLQGLALIAKVPLFSSIDASDYPALVGAFTSVEHEPGSVIVRQGEIGDRLIIIDGGKAAMKVADTLSKHWAADQEPQHVGVLRSGDCLGEAGLLDGTTWSATVEALEPLRVWTLGRPEFERLGLRQNLRMKRRMAFDHFSTHGSQASTALEDGLDVDAKSDAERSLLRGALRTSGVLGPVVKGLSDDELDMATTGAIRQRVLSGAEVTREGDTNTDTFYIIEEGSFSVLRGGQVVDHICPGRCFGARSLLHREPRSTTIRAESAGILWQVRRRQLRDIERKHLQHKLADAAGRIAVSLGPLRAHNLSPLEMRQLADALVEVAFHRGEHLLQQGESSQRMLILYRGSVTVEAAGTNTMDALDTKSADPEKGEVHIFGEQALVQEDWRSPVSVVAATETAVVLVLDSDDFQRITRPAAAAAPTGIFCKACRQPLLPYAKICPICETRPRLEFTEDFGLREGEAMRVYSRDKLEEVGLLGCGNFARVSLVRCTETNQTFALKAIRKQLVIDRKQQNNIKSERMILKTTRSPFLIRLVATFNREQHLDFLLEAALGGDLLTLYERHEEFFGSANHARFYVACVLRGLEHLHDRYIIYRDLKMENIMLDSIGYAKLTDFGLSKFVIGHTFTKCGTPDFMAPELVAGAGHTSAVDWWALGVLTYALVEGGLPFESSQTCLTFLKIQRGIDCARFEDEKAPSTELVKGLCKQEPRERLPVRAGGARGVMEHAWFADSNFDWAALSACSLAPPWTPPLKGPTDTQNFEPCDDLHSGGEPYTGGGDWDSGFADARGPACLESSLLGSPRPPCVSAPLGSPPLVPSQSLGAAAAGGSSTSPAPTLT